MECTLWVRHENQGQVSVIESAAGKIAEEKAQKEAVKISRGR